MPSLYLTPASISYLNQFLLALVITTYLGLRFFASKHQRPSKQDWLLVIFFVSTTVFSLALFLDVTLLPTERLLVVYAENTCLGILLIALTQFAYHFPAGRENQKIERRLALFFTSVYALLEAGFAIWRYQLLQQGQVEYRSEILDYPPVIGFLWVIFVFARGTFQNWNQSASRRFALIFLIPVSLAVVNLLSAYDLIPAPLYHISMSLGILATLFLFALNYLASKPESTSLMTKFSGAILTCVLAVLGSLAWLVAPAYAAQYQPTIKDHSTIRFTPNARGSYDVTEIPFHFESELGQNLGLINSDASQLSAAAVEFEFPFYGQNYQKLYISDDGAVSFGERLDYKDLEDRFSNLPVIFALMLDLNPEISPDGGVFVRPESGKLVITYSRLKATSHPENVYTFQVSLDPNGSFDLTYNGLSQGQQYYVNDSPAAAIWARGAKPARPVPQTINSYFASLTGEGEGEIQDEYRSFRQFLHNFLLPLATAILASNLLFLVGLPLVMAYGLTRPLSSLLIGVEQLNQGATGAADSRSIQRRNWLFDPII